MSGLRQVYLGFFMALVSSTIVLGSLSLSLLEGGYVLAQGTTSESEMVFSSEPILTLAGSAVVEGNASAAPAEEVTIFTPTPSGCPHPATWVAIVVRPEDSLRSLAHRYSTSVHLLKTNNCLDFDTLVANSTLYVPDVPPLPTPTRPPPTYPWLYPTPYPTVPRWPTATPWVPTRTPVNPPTLPPTLPPPPTDLPPPTDSGATATQPPPATEVPPTEAPPTQPAPTEVPPTQPPPTQPPPPTQAPPPTATVEIYPFP